MTRQFYNKMHHISHTVPQVPTGFVIALQYPTITDKTLTFEWDLPRGMGPEVIVDYYWVSIAPIPLSHPILNFVYSSPWNVTVDYNTVYSANITAVNCAGESETFTLPDFEYGMHKYRYTYCPRTLCSHF